MNKEEKKAIEKFKFCGGNFVLDKESSKVVLNLIEKLQKENEELKFEERRMIIGKYEESEIHDVINKILSNDYIPVQKVKDKLEEMQKEYNKLDEQVDEYIKRVDLSKYYENKEKIAIMQTLAWFIDELQELIEEREEK